MATVGRQRRRKASRLLLIHPIFHEFSRFILFILEQIKKAIQPGSLLIQSQRYLSCCFLTSVTVRSRCYNFTLVSFPFFVAAVKRVNGRWASFRCAGAHLISFSSWPAGTSVRWSGNRWTVCGHCVFLHRAQRAVVCLKEARGWCPVRPAWNRIHLKLNWHRSECLLLLWHSPCHWHLRWKRTVGEEAAPFHLVTLWRLRGLRRGGRAGRLPAKGTFNQPRFQLIAQSVD